jgi:ATP-dependent DNA helicase DinG
MGGNGFMAVSATHAALRLAQGAGRLIRRGDDRGVVAFLDSRMMTARYAGFLQRSLPPFWPTTDRERVLAALRRLDETAPEPVTVHEPALRGVTGAVAGTTMGDGAEHPRPVADSRPVAPAPPPAASSRTAVTQGHSWTADADEELRDGVDLGLTLEELAESLELPEDVVAARLRGLGLSASGAARMSFD